MAGEIKGEAVNPEEDKPQARSRLVQQCDRCGFDMIEMNCKLLCPNCGTALIVRI